MLRFFGHIALRTLVYVSVVALSAATLRAQPGQCVIQRSWKDEIIPEKDRDLASTRASVTGRYKISARPRDDSIPRNRVHDWIIHVEDPQGVPLDSATICIDGGMPEHGHGLPTRPRVTQNLANGDYLVEGMKFSMGGWWVVKVTIVTPTASDTARFNLKLP